MSETTNPNEATGWQQPMGRSPILALLLNVFFGVTGHIYAGKARRGLLLFLAAVVLCFLVLYSVNWPLDRLVYVLLMGGLLMFSLFIWGDAFHQARINRQAQRKPYQRWWVYLLCMVAFPVASYFLTNFIRASTVEAYMIPTRSMTPTVSAGDRILVDPNDREPAEVQRGELVMYLCPDAEAAQYFLGRVIGLPGETIEVRDEVVLIDGQPYEDPMAVHDDELPKVPVLTTMPPLTIPDDAWFVMGDNRRASRDSRDFGPVPRKIITASLA